MTFKDKELIEKALKLDYTYWGTAEAYAKKADTPEAKDRLQRISSNLYRKEEYFAGLL